MISPMGADPIQDRGRASIDRDYQRAKQFSRLGTVGAGERDRHGLYTHRPRHLVDPVEAQKRTGPGNMGRLDTTDEGAPQLRWQDPPHSSLGPHRHFDGAGRFHQADVTGAEHHAAGAHGVDFDDHDVGTDDIADASVPDGPSLTAQVFSKEI